MNKLRRLLECSFKHGLRTRSGIIKRTRIQLVACRQFRLIDTSGSVEANLHINLLKKTVELLIIVMLPLYVRLGLRAAALRRLQNLAFLCEDFLFGQFCLKQFKCSLRKAATLSSQTEKE